MMRTSLAGAALVAAVALSACGGSGGGGQTSQATNLSPSTPATQSTTSGASGTASATTSAAATGTQTAATQTGTATGNSGGAGLGVGSSQCKAAGLTLSYLGGQGATGHGELGFALKNAGSSACATGGYPGIQFLAKDGSALATTPQHTTDDFFGHLPRQQLTIQPGQTASFRLGVSHGGGSSAPCSTADGLQVIAPNDTATLKVQIPNGASECGTTTVSPLQPGTSAFQ